MASDPQTWAELQASVIAWLVRDDLDDRIPEFIAMAERRFNRVLRVPQMEDVSTAPVSVQTVTLPTDFLALISVYLDTTPNDELRQLETVDLMTRYGSNTGQPVHYALQSFNEIMFGPTPDVEYNVVINYYAKIPALSDSQTTNWLLTGHSDLYIAATLAEGFMATQNMGMWEKWEAITRAKIQEVTDFSHRDSTLGIGLRGPAFYTRSGYNIFTER